MFRTLYLVSLVATLAVALTIGCSKTNQERLERDATNRGINEGSERLAEELQNENDDQAESSDPAEVEPVYNVGNEECPFTGEAASLVVNVNGYGIGVCCMGCRQALTRNPSAQREVLMEKLNIDIEVPATEMVEATTEE